MNYTIQYFIDKFERIPEKKWTTFQREDKKGRRCAHGWCAGFDVMDTFTKEEEVFREVIAPKIDGNRMGMVNVNNGRNLNYQQPTPKQRVLAALYDLRAKQEPKEKVVYKSVLIDSRVKRTSRRNTYP